MTQINQVLNPFVPDAYINVVTPSVPLVGGVQTDLIGVVGTAAWGPVGAPTAFSNAQDYANLFGNLVARKYDMGTAAAAAMAQGAANFRGVRVTDTTDVAASVIIQTSCLTCTSRYTGSAANGDTVAIAPGSQTGTFKATVTRPGRAPEVFDNIGLGLTANALWVAIAAAINNGSGLRGPSQLIVASAGAGTTAPATASYTLASGTDGATTITSTVLAGVDTGTRTGMYALRGIGPAILVLADADDSTVWTTQNALAIAEGFYVMLTGPSGEYTAPATVASNKATAGIDSASAKVLVGDWCYWLDTVNGGQQRLISPQGFAAGRLAAQGPEQSGLNKPIQGIIDTQKTRARQRYSTAELAIFGQSGLDLITNPAPGGSYFALRFGQNSSSNAAIDGDNFSRMVPYLAARFATVSGQFVGMVQTADQRREAKACFDAALFEEWQNKPTPRLSNPQGTQPYVVTLDDSNNPPSRVARGFEQVDIKAQLGPIIAFFVLNLEAGQTVQISQSFALAA